MPISEERDAIRQNPRRWLAIAIPIAMFTSGLLFIIYVSERPLSEPGAWIFSFIILAIVSIPFFARRLEAKQRRMFARTDEVIQKTEEFLRKLREKRIANDTQIASKLREENRLN